MKDSGIGNNQTINIGFPQKNQVVGKTVKVTVMGKYVNGYIDFDPMGMGIIDRPNNTGIIKITGPSPKTVLQATQVDGIGTVMYGRNQFIKIAGRGQQFRNFYRHFYFLPDNIKQHVVLWLFLHFALAVTKIFGPTIRVYPLTL